MRSGSNAVLGYERIRPETVVFGLLKEQLGLECTVAAILCIKKTTIAMAKTICPNLQSTAMGITCFVDYFLVFKKRSELTISSLR